jgi:hypothetical protein
MIEDDRHQKLECSLAELQRNYQLIAEVLATPPTIAELEAAIAHKKKSQQSERAAKL